MVKWNSITYIQSNASFGRSGNFCSLFSGKEHQRGRDGNVPLAAPGGPVGRAARADLRGVAGGACPREARGSRSSRCGAARRHSSRAAQPATGGRLGREGASPCPRYALSVRLRLPQPFMLMITLPQLLQGSNLTQTPAPVSVPPRPGSVLGSSATGRNPS